MHVRMSVCGYVKPTICLRKVLCGSCMIGTSKIQDVDYKPQEFCWIFHYYVFSSMLIILSLLVVSLLCI